MKNFFMQYKRILPVCFFLISSFNPVCFAQQPKLKLPIGHTDDIYTAQFSPDGKKVITVSKDNTTKLWDTEKGYLLADMKQKTGYLAEARFSPDGKKIVIQSRTAKDEFEESENLFTVWDAVTGDSIAFPEIHSKGIKNLPQFNADGSKLVIISDSVRTWKTKEHHLAFTLRENVNNIRSLQFSPDDKWLLTLQNDKRIKVWDALNGKLIQTLPGLSAPAFSLYFSAGATELTAVTLNESISWNTASWIIKRKIQGKIDSTDLSILTPDAKNIITASYDPGDRFVKLWNATTRNFSYKIAGEYAGTDTTDIFQGDRWLSGKVTAASNTTIAAVLKTIKYNDFSFGLSNDKTVKLWNAATGKLVDSLVGHTDAVIFIQFSPDGKKIITASDDRTAKIWDAATGQLLVDLGGHTFNIRDALFSPPISQSDPGGKQIITTSDDGSVKLWDAATGVLLKTFKGNTGEVFSAQYSKDGKKIITASRLGTVYIFEIETGKTIPLSATRTVSVDPTADEPENDRVTGMIPPELSPDGKKAISAIHTQYLSLYDAETGNRSHQIEASDFRRLRFAHFSKDGKKIISGWIPEFPGSKDSTVSVWDTETGNLLYKMKQRGDDIYEAAFSADSKKIFTFSNETNKRIAIWDAENGKQLDSFKINNRYNYMARLSGDDKKIMLVDFDSTVQLFDAKAGRLLATLKETREFHFATFSPDNKKIATHSPEGGGEIWDAETGNLLLQLKGHQEELNIIRFSPDMKRIITTSIDNTAKVWDAITGNFLYTFFAIDSADYLVVDKDNHFDGTKAAIGLLYFTCGTEVIELKQAKEQLYIPGLVNLINKGEVINTKTLDELDLCGLTPETGVTSSNTGDLLFKIKPRRGGIGATELFINGKMLSAYQPGDLDKTGDGYELKIRKEKLLPFLPDPTNDVSVKAYTDADHNSVPSREVSVTVNNSGPPSSPPNLYAVMVGISDYKDTAMHLNYAAIDANDMSNAVSDAAKKLLGNDHVFTYNLTTAGKHDLLPYKKNIKQVFDSIGKKAAANDILLIFLSGHGVTRKKDNQFYYMTAEASSLEEESVSPDVGISTADLTEWMKLENIKAQKRILIMDACYSGQAINNFITLGSGNSGFLAARGDDNWQQKKAIESLNDNSGMVILSASSSLQRAWESKAYSHGYLTYSLLLAIKESNNEILNVSEWFSAAKKTVMEVSKKWGAAQEPQFIPFTNFPIGMVDKEVMANIKLPDEKQLFAPSNFQNRDEAADGDNLLLGQKIDAALNEISSTKADSKIVFVVATSSADACILSGRYDVRGDIITVTVSIKKNNERKNQFEEKGTTDKLPDLAKRIAEKAAEWVGDNMNNK